MEFNCPRVKTKVYKVSKVLVIIIYTVLVSYSLLHVDPSCRMNIDDATKHSWLDDAPDTELHSPAVIADKVSNSVNTVSV